MNVHAKSCLTPEPLRTLRSEIKGQAQPARTGRRPSPARCGDQSRGEKSVVQLACTYTAAVVRDRGLLAQVSGPRRGAAAAIMMGL